MGGGTAPEALYVSMTRGRDGNHAHVITRPANEDQPTGAAHGTPRREPLAVLASILRTEMDTAGSGHPH